MADNGNKFISTIFWTLIIGSFSWATCIGLLNAKAQTEEKDCRIKEDKEIRQDIVVAVQKQQDTNEKTSVVLSRILTKLEIIEQKVQ